MTKQLLLLANVNFRAVFHPRLLFIALTCTQRKANDLVDMESPENYCSADAQRGGDVNTETIEGTRLTLHQFSALAP